MRETRPPWDERIMQLAEWWAQWSTCRWMQTGAVVVDAQYQVLVSGFNGPARGQPHCWSVDQPRELHRDTCLHAERNCILQAARCGVGLEGRALFSLHRPCIRCVPDIIQVGLASVTWRHPYESDNRGEEALSMLYDAGLLVLSC
jgi:dCMP deaminase